jgi:hypothetical protein
MVGQFCPDPNQMTETRRTRCVQLRSVRVSVVCPPGATVLGWKTQRVTRTLHPTVDVAAA